MADTNLIQNNHTAQNGVVILDRTQSKNKLSNKKQQTKYGEPPDGGARAWLVVISAFLCNSILFGIINTYGTVYLKLQENLKNQGDTESSSKASLVGSLTIGTTFLLSPVSGILTDFIGLRKTTLIGGALAAGGMFISSFYTSDIEALYVTYGIMFGMGAALAYTPTIAILGHYFKKYLGKVSGFVASGSSVCTAILPSGLNYLLQTYGLKVTFTVLSVMTLFIMVCALIFKPLQAPAAPLKPKPGQTQANALIRSLVNVENWKKKRYIIWALSIPVALFGYFVPYVHLPKLVKITYPLRNENSPIMCIGITSGLGRILFGYIADIKGVNRIYLQQISFIVLGLVTMLMPYAQYYEILILLALIMGLVDGCFISLLGPIAFDICGARGAAQAIGFLLGLCAIPLTVGPPIAGMLFDQSNSYSFSFILAGIPPIIGASIMMMIKFVKDVETAESELVSDIDHLQSMPLAKPGWTNDVEHLGENGNHDHFAAGGRKASLASTESLKDTSN